MGLHAIDTEGNITWHCHNPTCKNHNCAAWDHAICTHHAGNTQPGESLTAHISHEGVRWAGPSLVDLPACACGSVLSVVVGWTEAELQKPIVMYDVDGNITSVDFLPGAAHNFTRVVKKLEQKRLPDPNHPGDFIWQNTTRIVSVTLHPMVARHLELAKQLQAAGKTRTT